MAFRSDDTAEFFAAGGVSLGTIVRQFNQASASDSTDDAFLGWIDAGGIESVTITGGDIASTLHS